MVNKGRRRKRNKVSGNDNTKNFDLVGLGNWDSSDDQEVFIMDYDKNSGRTDKRVKDLREAAKIHREVRKYCQQELIKPGAKLYDISSGIENRITNLFKQNTDKMGIGFPTGLSINNIAAHDSANPGDVRVLNYGDVCKIDFGTHVNGNIIDSAFTVAFDQKFEPLINASRDGTWTGINLAGPDALINEISEGIREAIESYEIELDGKTYPIHSIKNLGGHNIEPYRIHANKLVLGGPDESQEGLRMDVNECFAIETFATTGDPPGAVLEDNTMQCNHFMRKWDPPFIDLKLKGSRRLYSHINKVRSSLPFCSRWLDEGFGSKWSGALNDLIKKGLVDAYPPLVDKPGTYTSQLEHTIFLHDYGKEVLSKGPDY